MNSFSLRTRGLVLSSLAVAGSISASSFVFGPKIYTVESGKTQVLSETVLADDSPDCDGVASYVLIIQNGDPTGRNGVSSGRITFNGTILVRESDLNPHSGTMTIPVVVEPASVLGIELKGGSQSSSLTLSIRKSIERPVRPATTLTMSLKQQSFDDAFSLSDASGTFVLSVQNGTPAGTSRVKSAAILVNGQTVVSDLDLDRSVADLTRVVTLQGGNSVHADLKGDSGDRLTIGFKREVDENACGPKVFFQEPAAGAVLSTAFIRASGTAVGRQGTAVTVNGAIAEIDFSHAGTSADPFLWFAEVPALDGTVVLRATATDPGSATALAEREIIHTSSPDAFAFTPSSRSGVAPLPVRFHVAPVDGVEIARYDVDLDGDGIFEASFSELSDPLGITYQNPGQYTPQIRCVTVAGNTLNASTHVSVQSFVVMDGIFRAAWIRLMSAFANGDVDAALREMSPAAREKYGQPLRTIRTDLPTYAKSVTGFNAVWIGETAAHYLLIRNIEGRNAGYHVYFTRGADGVWRMSQF